MVRGWEWILIFVALLLLFGPRLPQVGSSLGQAIRNFKKAFSEPDAPEEEKKDGQKLAATAHSGTDELKAGAPAKASSKES